MTDAVQVGPAPADPFELVRDWLPGNDDPARPEMTLATVGADGMPNARAVLLSSIEDDGFALHTDAASRKVHELDANPVAALVFRLAATHRQLVVQGVAGRASEQQNADAFARRSAYLQELMWLNTPAFAQLPETERAERWAAFPGEQDVAEQPSAWTGFVVRPTRMLFWGGSPRTAGRRLEYVREGDTWRSAYLPG